MFSAKVSPTLHQTVRVYLATLSLLALVLVGGGWTAGWYSAHENNWIRSCPERYGYQPFSGPVNATRYLTDLGETPARPWADELARGRRRPPGWCLAWNP